ncbi:hypothetical protein ABZ299_35100 [Streptomyces sp. NPDC006184]|uniref:hypothetical protein n=1 Tax=Streptomyces sp. NPDC006184 TaxID=3155455 RepID=UPI0033B0C35B
MDPPVRHHCPGAVLVRPDGFVAWRSNTGPRVDPWGYLTLVFTALPAPTETFTWMPEALTSVALPTVKLSPHLSLLDLRPMECLISKLAEPTGLPLRSRSTRAATSRHILVRVMVM